MSEREEKFEKMLQAVQQQYEATVMKLDKLKAEGKNKTAAYKQLLCEKLTLQNILSMYRVYGLIE
ncbi:MAG: hypothetical protein ACI4KM_09030 [Oscillospiraceae bacterium]